MIYSGKFVLRVDPELHQALAERANHEGVSLNEFCNQTIRRGLNHRGSLPLWKKDALQVLPYLKTRFEKYLLGFAAFGSRVLGSGSPSSDLDLLILLRPSIAIQRSLYYWWEETIPPSKYMERNPHFVHLPSSPEEAGGFWFEIALNSEIFYEKKKVLSRWLTRLQEYIDSGRVVRHFSHGHPYWERIDRKVS